MGTHKSDVHLPALGVSGVRANKLKFVGHRFVPPCPAAVPAFVPSRKPLFPKGLTRFSTIFEKKVHHTCATELRKPFFLLGLHFPSRVIPHGTG